MTDDRLRTLERRFRETGSVEDEALWLTQRLRAGEVTQDRVRLAACCGSQAAREVLGHAAPERQPSLRDWVVGLPACATQALKDVVGTLDDERDRRRLLAAFMWRKGDATLDGIATRALRGPRVSKWTRELLETHLGRWALGYGDPGQ